MKFYDNNNNQIALCDISKIVIYGNGEKLFTKDSGNFESYKMKKSNDGTESKLDSVYMGAPVAITFLNPVKRANKENLNRKDNYTLTYFANWDKYTARKALYIHTSEINIINLGDVLAMETEDEKNYLRACKLTFRGSATFNRPRWEKIPCAGNWTLPEGARWSSAFGTEKNPCFDTYDNSKSLLSKKRGDDPNEKGVIKRWITQETIKEGAEIIDVERFYTKTIYTADRERKNAIAEKLNKSGLFHNQTFSHYDIDKIEKALNIKL